MDERRVPLTFQVSESLAADLQDGEMPLVIAAPCHAEGHGLTFLAVLLTGAQAADAEGQVCQEGLRNAMSALAASMLSSMQPNEMIVWLSEFLHTASIDYLRESQPDMPMPMMGLLSEAMVAKVCHANRGSAANVINGTIAMASITGDEAIVALAGDLLAEMQKEGAERARKAFNN